MTIRTINRDPFARTSLVREAVPLHEQCRCDWCGAYRKRQSWLFVGSCIVLSLFRYGTRPDSIRGGINWHNGVFCSKGCHDAYHGS